MQPPTIHLRVLGMHCSHCSGRVEEALRAVPGSLSVVVSLEESAASVVGNASPEALVAAVIAIGFEAESLPATAAAPGVVELRVDGMHCSHCVGRVQDALCAVPAVEAAEVDLEACRARVRGRAKIADLVAAVQALGFTAGVAAAGDAAAPTTAVSSSGIVAQGAASASAVVAPDVAALGFVPIQQRARPRLAPAPNTDADADVEAGLLYSS